ncbi:MAG: hypothetical protein ACI9LM_002670 [Alteromonadaceae bacterium]|jgi:hypothetical protein
MRNLYVKIGQFMLKIIFLLILSLFFSTFLLADVLTLNSNAPKSYVVKKGDTLWDISDVFLKEPWLWPKLWRINSQIVNPHLIYPGDDLYLVFDKQGEPMLVKGKPALKWSPTIRKTLKNQAPIKTLPLDVIAPYIKYDTVLSEEMIAALPYVLGNDEGYKSSVDGFNVYVHGDINVGQSYALYKKAEEIIDPITKESLGFYGSLVATGKGIRSGNQQLNEPATLHIEEAKQEIRSGSFVIPVNEGQLLPSFFTMQASTIPKPAAIIKASTGVREFGKLEVVMINVGASDAVTQGDVLSVKRQSPGVVETANGPVYTSDASRWNQLANSNNSDYNMPIETVGNLMIFKVYEKVSMALILNSNKPLRLKDIITAP